MTLSKRTVARTVSFSGMDGAGKSTQIELLRGRLEGQGFRVRILRFWDDIAALTQLREEAGHRVFRGERGIGTPNAPVNRRDKNVRGWPMSCLRLFIYLLDALSLRSVFRKAIRGDANLIIFDRYTYDELANLSLSRGLVRAYSRFLIRLVPKPDIGFVLDADPEAARARKPEYPLDFLRFNREAYLHLSRMFRLIVIPPGEIADAQREVLARTLGLLISDSASPKLDSENLRDKATIGAPPNRPAVL